MEELFSPWFLNEIRESFAKKLGLSSRCFELWYNTTSHVFGVSIKDSGTIIDETGKVLAEAYLSTSEEGEFWEWGPVYVEDWIPEERDEDRNPADWID